MSNQTAGFILCSIFLLIAVVSTIVSHEERKRRRGLPDPQPDQRNWQNIFMKDVK
jgi:hypothetical protein